MSNDPVEKYGWNKDMPILLLEKLKVDLKSAVLDKDAEAKTAIRQIMSEYPKLTVPLTLESGKKTTRLKKPEEITNDDILGIIQGLVKSEKIVLEIKTEETSGYLQILESYQPKMATREEIKSWVEENIDFSDFKKPMQAMGPVMKHFGKLADGNLVREVLNELSGG
ncbi:GatB/YqeY domain-containing protein [Thermodesulfobacteriota bacterium]